MTHHPRTLLLSLFAAAACVAAETPGDPWAALDQEARTAAVNEGPLRLLTEEAAAGTHVHENRIRIEPQSLGDGWVRLDQCHRDLDPVPAAEVVFRPGHIRNLQVTRSEGIGRAWVLGHSVQMEEVGPDALLCIRAESLALQDLGEGRYRLRTGPYMRRFLDGYYPMHLALQIEHPPTLRLMAQYPQPHPGFRVTVAEGRVDAETNFEGRLFTCFDFCTQGQETCAPIDLPCDPMDGGVP